MNVLPAKPRPNPLTVEQVEDICAAMFVCAGKEATDAHFEVWVRALANCDECDDEQLGEVLTYIMRRVNFSKCGPPCPAMFLEQRRDFFGIEAPVVWTSAYRNG